ncbi:hypothetical protein SASPL_106745 [Salvia splendens]|uniref:Serine aminopeptidase S33 domain-containing protein n=1 Tax=Salvia splendens TaxID=180675 RepID=A0A8X8YNC3_SALSN|nr:hypothetical protein SASPL_106745 [Salvia splendens]
MAAIAAGNWPSILRQRYESTATAKIRLISKSELSFYASPVRKEKQLRELAPRSPFTTLSDGGPPRWFSPLECRSRLKDSPLLLYLPDLVKFVESTVKTEHSRAPNRPIYLAGESLGACIALAVAARNPEIDLALILANPATSLGKSLLEPLSLLPLSTMMPEQLGSSLPYFVALLLGSPAKMVTTLMSKCLPLDQMIEVSSQESTAISSYLSLFTAEILRWKVNLLKSAAAFANSRLHAVKAQTLILARLDKVFPSREEADRLCQVLQKCQVRLFSGSGHALFLEMQEHGFSLISILTGASFYRRGEHHNYVSDYFPPTRSEFQRIYDLHRWSETAFNPVVLSTMENGDIVRSLDGIPSEGPVLYVGNHMMFGFEVLREGRIPPPFSAFDNMRIMGAVPVSATNFYRLLSSNSHVLLYPGGMRESLHRKGEEYKLFWPEQPEFVRVAAKFGANIVPFGVVGEDDICHLLLDYNDLTRIPYIKNAIEGHMRRDAVGEVSNEDVHLPVIAPTQNPRPFLLLVREAYRNRREQGVKVREKGQEIYLEVKREVEECLAYLQMKRESDPYRHIVARLSYQAIHGFFSEVSTFDFTKIDS